MRGEGERESGMPRQRICAKKRKELESSTDPKGRIKAKPEMETRRESKRFPRKEREKGEYTCAAVLEPPFDPRQSRLHVLRELGRKPTQEHNVSDAIEFPAKTIRGSIVVEAGHGRKPGYTEGRGQGREERQPLVGRDKKQTRR